MKELKLHFYPKGPHDLELRHLFKASLRNKRFNWASEVNAAFRSKRDTLETRGGEKNKAAL